MNTQNAQKIAKQIGKIAEVASTFYALYGSDYKLKETSPKQAWELYNEFMTRQSKVANLLDANAVENAHIRWEAWWERRDVINIALVNHLSSEAFRLIERAAILEARGEVTADSMRRIQETIAGLLHPSVRSNQSDMLGMAS
jgi:hypothetical protein